MRHYIIGLALLGFAGSVAADSPALTPPKEGETSPRLPREGTLGKTREETVGGVRLFERAVKTGVAEQPEIVVIVRLPRGHTAQTPTAKGVLAYCTWQKEPETLRGRLADASGSLVRFADKHGLALMTWNTETLWKTGSSHDHLARGERAAQRRRFDAVSRAWGRAVGAICREFALPEKKMLLYGISRGAHYGLRLALRDPGRFLAVHIHVANSYEKPTRAAAATAWLISSGDLDRGRENTLAFYREAKGQGVPILLKIQNGLGHAASPQVEALRDAFFDYALDVDQSGRRPWEVLAAALSRPPFFGEMLSQQVFPAAEADFLPESQKMALPSSRLAEAWKGR